MEQPIVNVLTSKVAAIDQGYRCGITNCKVIRLKPCSSDYRARPKQPHTVVKLGSNIASIMCPRPWIRHLCILVQFRAEYFISNN